MDFDTLAKNFDLQVVAGDVMATDDSGVMQTIGKLSGSDVALNDVGTAMTADMQPRRRRRAQADPAPVDVVETPPGADLSLSIDSTVTTGDQTG